MKVFAKISIFSILVFSACKKPSTCIELSSADPKFGQEVIIDATCSKSAKWYDYYVNGDLIDGTSETKKYVFDKPGENTIKVIAYSKRKGSNNSRTGCDNCLGAGKTSELSKAVHVSETYNISANSPLNLDQTLNITIDNLSNTIYKCTFNWAGPNNYTYTGFTPTIEHVSMAHQGVYSLTATYNGYTTKTTTIMVNMNPMVIPCTPSVNQCIFTGGSLPATTFSAASHSVNNDQMTFYAVGQYVDLKFTFIDGALPADGIYTISTDKFNLAKNEVFAEIKAGGAWNHVTINSGKIYIKTVNSKVTVTFCSLPFTESSVNYAVTGNYTE